jgi:aquaporin Z
MKKYIVELIGTFFLVFVIGCSVLGGAGAMAPVAIGLTLATMVYAGGHISGAHYNPAVTVAVWLRGKCDTKDVLPYIGSQVVGALLASGAVSYLYATKTGAPVGEVGKAFVAELLGTLALAWVVLNVATTKANNGNSFYGASIGLTVTSMAYALGGVSGGAFNPAVAIGGSQMGLFHTGSLWIYLVACTVGGAVAAAIFKFVNKGGE